MLRRHDRGPFLGTTKKSGTEKHNKDKHFLSGDCLGEGGGSPGPGGWPGVKSLCAVCGQQGTQTFASGHPARRIGDQVDREVVYVRSVHVPSFGHKMRRKSPSLF